MEKAFGYVRVSTNDQAQYGVSLEAQEERIRAYCTMAGLDLVEIVSDPAVSAGKLPSLTQRPGGQRVVAALKSGAIKHVVCLKLDRMFRDAAECLNQTKEWDRSGVSVHFIDLGGIALSTTTPMGRMFMTLAAAFAELERNLIAERTKVAMAHLKSKGVKLGAPAMGDNETEADTVARVLDLHANGLSLREICDKLSSEGHKTKRGGSWYPGTLAKILRRANGVAA